MSHWTIVPVRGLATGKSRLAGLLGAQERRALNAMLLERALDAIEGSEGDLSRCIVASAGADLCDFDSAVESTGVFDGNDAANLRGNFCGGIRRAQKISPGRAHVAEVSHWCEPLSS